jgi:hypothetical protein
MSDDEDDLLAELEAIVGIALGDGNDGSADVASSPQVPPEPASGVSFEEFLALQVRLALLCV